MSGIIGSAGLKSGIIGLTPPDQPTFYMGRFYPGTEYTTHGETIEYNVGEEEQVDGKIADNMASGVYSCPKAGYYQIIISIDGDSGTAANTHIGVGLKRGSTVLQQSAAIGYGDTEDIRIDCNLNAVSLATTSDSFHCYTYIAAGTGCGIHQARLSIIFLGVPK